MADVHKVRTRTKSWGDEVDEADRQSMSETEYRLRNHPPAYVFGSGKVVYRKSVTDPYGPARKMR